MTHPEELPRREFARQCLGGLSAVSFAAPLIATEDSPPPPALPEDPASPASRPSVELLILSALVENYADEHYTPEILRGIYREIAADQARSKQLRAFPLQNSDEPACTFHALLVEPSAEKEAP
jgi:hypothetical protein